MSLELNQEELVELIKVLWENTDVFAWSIADMPGVSSNVITHKLNTNLTCHLVKQKKRNFPSDQSQAIDEEVAKLLEANFICEVNYPDWFVNVVLAKKGNGK